MVQQYFREEAVHQQHKVITQMYTDIVNDNSHQFVVLCY